MPRPRPACGTYNGYHAHLRRGEPLCDPCAEARTLYHREYYRDLTRMVRPDAHHVDAGPAREAIHQALDGGVRLSQIVAATGLSDNALSKIRDGGRRCRADTLRRVVEACERLYPDHRRGHRDAQITRLRLRNLHQQGATWQWLSEQLGIALSQIDRLVHRDQSTVSNRIADKVDALTVAVGRGDVQIPRGPVGKPCRGRCGRYTPKGGACPRCRKREQRARDRERYRRQTEAEAA